MYVEKNLDRHVAIILSILCKVQFTRELNIAFKLSSNWWFKMCLKLDAVRLYLYYGPVRPYI